MPAVDEPSSERLLDLLRQARESIVESQRHWASIQHLTGDRRNQRRHQELLALLDAVIRGTQSAAKSWARDKQEKLARASFANAGTGDGPGR